MTVLCAGHTHTQLISAATFALGFRVWANRQAFLASARVIVGSVVWASVGETVICTDTPCLSLLKHLIQVQGGAIKMTELSPDGKVWASTSALFLTPLVARLVGLPPKLVRL